MKKLVLFLTFYCINVAVSDAQVSTLQISESLQQSLQKEHFSNYSQVSFLITDKYTSEHNGITHVYVNQLVNGLEVFNANAALHFSNEGKLLIFHNGFIDKASEIAAAKQPKLAAIDALKLGTIKEGMAVTADLGKGNTEAGGKLSWSDPAASSEKLYAKLGYLNKEGKLFLVWQVEFFDDKTNDWWNMHIEANDGVLLQQHSYTAHCNFSQYDYSGESKQPQYFFEEEVNSAKKSTTGTYHVFPLPYESPSNGPRAYMSDIFTTNGSPYGWHDTDGVTGNEFTITRGNNVWAKEDTLANNGASGTGYSPNGDSTLTFDFPYSVDAKPRPNLNTAITNLFYWNNLMHDIFYNYGFNEEAGNFQQKNLSGKGLGKDAVNADAQDGSGTGNANFSTPVDGSSGRMQMYLWPTAAAKVTNTLKILSPSNLLGIYSGPQALFGPRLSPQGIQAEVILLKDSNATTSYACGLVANASELNGKIALLERGGTCTSYPTKVLAAQNAGAIAVIVIQNPGFNPTAMTGTSSSITIPSIMISRTTGTNIKSALLSGAVQVHVFDSSAFNLARIYDSDLDNGVIAHEYGHGISNRLTGGPANSSCLNNKEQCGEGWSDFFALALTTRVWEKSATVARGIGTFVIDQDTSGLGIRNYRYSRNMSVNPVTYKTIITQPEVHSLGFVWCAMLFDAYWDMIDKYGFDPDVYTGTGGNNKMLQLVIDGLKLQPCSPGFVDSRNAILKADSINNGGANYDLLWKAFARRGLGYTASQGSSNSATDGVEKFDLPPSVKVLETQTFDQGIRMYPNPASKTITIDLFGGSMVQSVQIFDITGKLVQSENFDTLLIPSATLYIGNHDKGWYIVRINNEHGSVCKKLLIN
ncbi:MAG: T9SS-dependent M36 family metallopeptidase [Bacteroidota bacterium]|nr:T9SS-dependent M36 family metallopeptidase [Bacteroidota bacterium]